MKTLIRFTAVVAIGLAAITTITTAFGHAAYVSSTPAKGEVLETAPARVRITFEETMQKGAANFDITVMKDGGGSVTNGAAAVDPADAHIGAVSLQSGLGAGRYVVNWTNVSAEDGDPAEGAFSFYIQQQPTAADLAADTALEAVGAEEEATPTAEASAPTTAPAAPTAAATLRAAVSPAAALPATGDGPPDGTSSLPWVIGAVAIGGLLLGVAGVTRHRID